MKKSFIYFLLFSGFLSVLLLLNSCNNYVPVLNSYQGVHFKVISLADAKALAKLQGRPLFLFAHATWCPTCKKMEHEELIKPQLGDVYNKQFINIAIDIDSEDGKALNKIYKIVATPTLFYFSPDGTLIKKTEGFANADNLLLIANAFKN